MHDQVANYQPALMFELGRSSSSAIKMMHMRAGSHNRKSNVWYFEPAVPCGSPRQILRDFRKERLLCLLDRRLLLVLVSDPCIEIQVMMLCIK